MDTIMNLSVNEILLLNGLADVAKEAKEAAEIIQKAYTFKCGEDKIEVYHDKDYNNFEYFTHDGVWQARYLHQSYDVICTPDEIFKYFRAEYMIKSGFAKEFDGSAYTSEGQMMQIANYFRSFVNHSHKKLDASIIV